MPSVNLTLANVKYRWHRDSRVTRAPAGPAQTRGRDNSFISNI